MDSPPDDPAGDGAISPGGIDLSAIPLFPLPGVVLFPRAVLPLHIFEHRYRLMTADALAGDRLVAMALLKPGWERDYHGRPAIEPVVCVGRILNSERLPDGKYNFLLQGELRATVVREHTDRPYRYARLTPLPQTPAMEIDLSGERDRLAELFAARPLAQLPLAEQFRKLCASPLPTSDLSDLVAFHFVEQLALKQALLCESDVRRRVRALVAAMEAMSPLSAMLARDDRATLN